MSLDQGMQLLNDTWMSQAAANPDGVTALLDAPGGEGWLHLFHGDLIAAERSFSAVSANDTAGTSRLGLARVHLEHAATLLAADSLHRAAGLSMARYRRDHAGDVRSGPYQPGLAALAALHGSAEAAELAQFVAAAEATGTGVTSATDDSISAGLRALLAARQGGVSITPTERALLPDNFQQRLQLADLVEEGQVEAARALRNKLGTPSPDVIDPLGRDEEAGLDFESHYFDAALLHALARIHLAEAWRLGAGIQGPGSMIRMAVTAAWGGPVPDAVLQGSLPSAEAQPDWQALFLSPALDRLDWESYWTQGREGSSFLARLAERTPNVPWTAGNDNHTVDQVLRSASQLEPFLKEALIQGVGSEGASMVQDLGFTHLAMDRILRTRMRSLQAGGAAVQALRIGERTLDPNPGRLGGPEDAARTRVSFRNDRAFLVDLAHCLWRAGQTGSALDYLHPLTSQQEALAGVVYMLGQLDAASSIGKGGKASQL